MKWGTLEQRREIYQKYAKSEKGIANRKKKSKKYYYKSSYPKATSDDYEKYLKATTCECCGIEFGKLHTANQKCQDHDHNTGDIRGVICNRCNSAEGQSQTSERAYQVACYMAEYTPLMELIKQAQGDISGNPQSI